MINAVLASRVVLNCNSAYSSLVALRALKDDKGQTLTI